MRIRLTVFLCLFLWLNPVCRSQDPAKVSLDATPSARASSEPIPSLPTRGVPYALGPNDSLIIRVLNVDDLGTLPYVVDLRGDIDLPRIGRVHVEGLTVEALERSLILAYREYLRNPVVTIFVAEYRSQPVSVLGQVGAPGVYQIRGRGTLLEVISEAGGFKPDAGNRINLARMDSFGAIPVPNCSKDPQNHSYLAQFDIHSLMDGRSNDGNIALMPHDLVTVPKADLIYVFGAVRKPGGFVLSEKESVSVLQALTLAEGLDPTAAPKSAKILRTEPGTKTRSEIPVNIKTLIEGKTGDLPLMANDLLFIPKSTAKVVSTRTLEAIIQTGTGFAVYHPY